MTGAIYSWQKTPIDNESSDANIDWREGIVEAAQVNNNDRQMMARLAEWLEDVAGTRTTGGTDDAYTLTISAQVVAASGYFNGLYAAFTADRSNAGPGTLNLTPDGQTAMGPAPLRVRAGVEMAAGDIQPGGKYVAVHDGTQFVLVNPGVGTVTIDKLDGETRALLNSVGDIKPWLTDTPPAGWLICDGSAISRTNYPQLFALWGEDFGAGDGSTTFNLADLRNEFLRGVGTATGAVGTKQGEEFLGHSHGTGTLAPAQHQHGGVTTDELAFASIFAQGTDRIGTAQASDGQTGDADALGFTGALGSTGGDETRPRNMAVNWIVLADAAAASGAPISVVGSAGQGYTFDEDSDTSVDPGVGQIRFNAPFATMTEIAVNDQTSDSGNADVSSILASLEAVAGANKGSVKISNASDVSTFVRLLVTAVDLTPVGFSKLTVTSPPTGFNGSFANGEALRMIVTEATPGEIGATGPTGPNLGLDYQWNTATTGDPGAGKALLNVAQDVLSISKTNRQGKDQTATIQTWDNSTNPNNFGHLNFVDTADAGTFFLNFHISAALSDQGTYYTIPVVLQSVGDPIVNDAIIGIGFAAAGDKGLDGAGSGDVVGPASSTSNAIAGYANSSGKLLQNTPVTINPGTGDMAGIGSLTAAAKVTGLDFAATGTGANVLPVGTTGEEPAFAPGMIRYDTTLARLRAVVNNAWQTVVDLGSVNIWAKGQIKAMVTKDDWDDAWNLQAGLDFRVTNTVSAAVNLPLPADAATHLAGNEEGQEGTIHATFAAASGAGFDAGYKFPGGTVTDVSGGGEFTFYYRVHRIGGSYTYLLTGLGPWS